MIWKGRKGEVFTMNTTTGRQSNWPLAVLEKTECRTSKLRHHPGLLSLQRCVLCTDLGDKVLISLWYTQSTRNLCCVMCQVSTIHTPTRTQNSDLIAAINGVAVTNNIPKSAYDTKGVFTCGPLLSLFTCWLFLEMFFSIHWKRIKKILACFCVSKCSFSPGTGGWLMSLSGLQKQTEKVGRSSVLLKEVSNTYFISSISFNHISAWAKSEAFAVGHTSTQASIVTFLQWKLRYHGSEVFSFLPFLIEGQQKILERLTRTSIHWLCISSNDCMHVCLL